jgi:hypothetical protein
MEQLRPEEAGIDDGRMARYEGAVTVAGWVVTLVHAV